MRISDWSSDVCSSDLRLIAEAAGPGRADFLDATRIATALPGDSIATNLFMLGYAWQKGLLPLSAAALDTAIELNQPAVEATRTAFLWRRPPAPPLAPVPQAAPPPRRPGALRSPGAPPLSPTPPAAAP